MSTRMNWSRRCFVKAAAVSLLGSGLIDSVRWGSMAPAVAPGKKVKD
jgi:hypothetical protein